ncbi:MAG: DUF433 domain-containing protein [Candidatus Heimdallarchaeota archaeon]
MLVAPRIEVDTEVCGGKPCIAGTRLAVYIILEWLENGKSFADIIEAYPFLTEDDIRAAVSYARLTIEREDVIPLEVAT